MSSAVSNERPRTLCTITKKKKKHTGTIVINNAVKIGTFVIKKKSRMHLPPIFLNRLGTH